MRRLGGAQLQPQPREQRLRVLERVDVDGAAPLVLGGAVTQPRRRLLDLQSR